VARLHAESLGATEKDIGPFHPDPTVLLAPSVIKPLHGQNPRTILGQEWWDIERRRAYRSTGHLCLACGMGKTRLEAHEEYSIDFFLFRYTYIRAIPLCHWCHSYIHIGRLGALMERRRVSPVEYLDVKEHGDRLLREAGLNKQAHINKICSGNIQSFFPEETGTWGKWHLFLDGRPYYSRFKNVDEWSRFYRGIRPE